MTQTRPEALDFVQRAPVRVVAEERVAASPQACFAVLADTPTWNEWFPQVTRCDWTSEPPHGVGSTRRVSVRGWVVDERFIAWDPGERWGFTFLATNVPTVRAGVELCELTRDGTGTLLRYTMAIEPLPATRAFFLASRRIQRKVLSKALRNLGQRAG